MRRPEISPGDILADKVFLAYEVNGKTLPTETRFSPPKRWQKDIMGTDWVKYAYKISVDKA